MKDRIKKLRRTLDMTQQEFAEKIGVKRNTIGQYEIGRNEPIDTVINLICREFNVNEEWLRTGEGEMFKPKPSDVLDQLAYKYQFSNADYIIAEKFVSLSPNKRKKIVENVFGLLHEIEAALSDSDPYAPAYVGTEQPQPMDKLMESIKTLSSVAEAEAAYEKSLGIAPRTGSSALNTTGGTAFPNGKANGGTAAENGGGESGNDVG